MKAGSTTSDERGRPGWEGRKDLRLPVGTARRATERPSSRRLLGLSDHRTPASLARQVSVQHARVYLPALAAGFVALLAAGPGRALLLVAAVGLVAAPLRRFPMPLHLMPAARVLLAIGPPILGCGIFVLADLVGSQSFEISIGTAALAAAVALATALGLEIAARPWQRARPLRIAGLDDPAFAAALDRELLETGLREAELIGWLDTSESRREPDGGRHALREAVLSNRIDLVVGDPVALEGSGPGGRLSTAEALLDLPVRMIAPPQLYENLFGHVPMGTIDHRWYLFLMHPEFSSTRPLSDRIIELGVMVPLFVLCSPLLAVCALAIKLEDRGPVLFRQLRVGEGGRGFQILKLRTMTVGSESEGAEWSRASDARVTRVGGVLRRLHLDELPQVINVIRGEMSIVGPRPERPEMVAELERLFPHYLRRHLVKPGVTGWAQVRCGYAGSPLGTAWKLCHDLYYLKRRSRLVNAMIVAETLRIAGLDAHRPLRVPASQFLHGRELGLDLRAEAELADPRSPSGDSPSGDRGEAARPEPRAVR